MKKGKEINLIELDNRSPADLDQLLELISLFVHDLESPMVVMQAILRLLHDRRLDLSKKNHQELVASGQIAMERARSIIGDLMLVSKSGKMGIPIKLEPVGLCGAVGNSVDLIKPTAEENGVVLLYRRPEREYQVLADRDLLLRVLDNILYNAVRHSPPDSAITVRIEPGRDEATVRISDEGPGFQGFDPSELFDKYRQLQLRAEGKHRGVGLGLYFCEQVLKGMGGKILAQNGPQGGAEFYFTLKIQR